LLDSNGIVVGSLVLIIGIGLVDLILVCVLVGSFGRVVSSVGCGLRDVSLLRVRRCVVGRRRVVTRGRARVTTARRVWGRALVLIARRVGGVLAAIAAVVTVVIIVVIAVAVSAAIIVGISGISIA